MLIRAGTVIDQAGMRPADVLVAGERIAAVGPRLEPASNDEVFDASGALVIPGGIDPHTHFALPVGTVCSADDFASGTVAAACGGTTCVIDFAGAGREGWTEALSTWHERARSKAVVDYGFHLTVTSLPDDQEGSDARFLAFAEQGVTSVKLYMAYPKRLMVDDATLGRALAASVKTGVRVMVHAEDGAEIERLKAAALGAGRTAPATITEVRPPRVEAEAIRRAALLAVGAGAELYVVHLSSADGLQAVLDARTGGGRVHAETCPHYLFLDESRLRDPEEGQDFVCAPPLRRPSDRQALWDALGRREIDIVSTDHCPFTRADRRHGTGSAGTWIDFTEIPGGLPGVETRVSLLYQGVRRGSLTPERWVDLVAGAPSRLFGLERRKGAIRPGLDADLVVFDPEKSWTLDPARLHSRSDHSPYAGMTVRGWPVLTLSRGRVVARDGDPVETTPGWGRYVPRAPVRI